MNNNINGPKSQPISAVNERRPSLKFVDKVAKEMGLIGIVEPLNAPLRDDTAAICLYSFSVNPLEQDYERQGMKISSQRKDPTYAHDQVIKCLGP